MGCRICEKLLSLFDEQRQVSQLTVLHDEVDMCSRLDAVVQADDVWMVDASKNGDFGEEKWQCLNGEEIIRQAELREILAIAVCDDTQLYLLRQSIHLGD